MRERPADIVLFFPPAAIRAPPPQASLSIDGTVRCAVSLDPGTGEVTVAAGAARRVVALDPRVFGRPVVIRLAGSPAPGFRIGMQPAVAMPELGGIDATNAWTVARGAAIDQVAAPGDEVRAMPRGFQGAEMQAAGAVDHVSRAGGIAGWIVALDRAGETLVVELRCDGALLARTRADRPRPAAAPHADRAPLGRFVLDWNEVDRAALAACDPQAAVTVHAASGAMLDNVHRPVSARTALDFAGGAPVRDVPGISAVVPSWNYARYLPQRLGSLFAQEPARPEVIVLDDASSDASIAVARAVAEAARREVRIVANAANSGGVMPQWRRAAALAQGEFVMIAEADDVALPGLLPALAQMLLRRDDMAFAFCDSVEIDADGAVLRRDFKRYYAALGDHGLDREQVFPAAAFLRRFLLPRNLVLNASAVLWRTAALRAALARIGPELDGFRNAGDWRVYIEACRAGGCIGYIPSPLNQFRRHRNSVTGSRSKDDHLAEIERIHALLLSLHGDEPAVARKLAQHRATLRRLWNLPPVDAREGSA